MKNPGEAPENARMPRFARVALVPPALWLACFVAKVQWEFTSMAEPEPPSRATALYAVVIGLASQVGLLLVPIAVKRGRGLRVLVAMLMLPSAFVLGASLFEATSRALRAVPMELWISATYFAGCVGYAAGYLLLLAPLRPATRVARTATTSPAG